MSLVEKLELNTQGKREAVKIRRVSGLGTPHSRSVTSFYQIFLYTYLYLHVALVLPLNLASISNALPLS